MPPQRSYPPKFQFIDCADPSRRSHHPGGPNTLSPAQRKASAHAARTAHARKRLARTREYLARQRGDAPVSAPVAEIRALLALGPVSALSQLRNDPFNSASTQLSPSEWFLLDHYAQTVVPELCKYCTTLKSLGETFARMLQEWVHFSLANPGFLHGILLSACRHLIDRGYHAQHFMAVAATYKINCVRTVIDAINSPHFDRDSTFASIFILAFDEVWLGDAEMFAKHVHGAVKTVMMHGGPQQLGWNGFLLSLYTIIENSHEQLDRGLGEWFDVFQTKKRKPWRAQLELEV